MLVETIIGLNDKDNVPFSDDTINGIVENVKRAYSNNFGGCNVIYSDGGWFADNGTWYDEQSIIVRVYADDTAANRALFTSIAHSFKYECNQNAVLLAFIPAEHVFV